MSDIDDIENQLIIARAKLWTPDLDRLIRKWKSQVGKRQKGHLLESRKYRSKHYIFGIPSTVLAAIVTTGILSTFRNCDDCDDLNSSRCEADQWIRLAIGLISMLSIGLTAFITFINYQEKAKEHKDASSDYESLYRQLESILQVPGVHRGDPIATLQNIRDRYGALVNSSPSLPEKYSVDLSYSYSGNKSGPPKPEEIENNKASNSTSFLMKVFGKDKQKEEDVEIGLDLDNISPQLSGSFKDLTKMREREIEESKKRALKFELQRLQSHTKNRSSESMKSPKKKSKRKKKSKKSNGVRKTKRVGTRKVKTDKNDENAVEIYSEEETEIEIEKGDSEEKGGDKDKNEKIDNQD